ncbi:MAG: hypothetical protein ACRC46_11775 [Thermoguttaceae bacterium]
MKSIRIRCALGLVFLVASVLGCGQTGLKGLVPAHGVVMFNGTPVEEATVFFMTKNNSGGEMRTASAKTGRDGSFKLMTLNPGDGVYPGEYIVTVTKDISEGEAATETTDPVTGRKTVILQDTRVTKYMLPTKYREIADSGIVVTIPAGGDKKIAITLEGQVDTKPQTRGPGGGGRR